MIYDLVGSFEVNIGNFCVDISSLLCKNSSLCNIDLQCKSVTFDNERLWFRFFLLALLLVLCLQ